MPFPTPGCNNEDHAKLRNKETSTVGVEKQEKHARVTMQDAGENDDEEIRFIIMLLISKSNWPTVVVHQKSVGFQDFQRRWLLADGDG